MTSYIVNIFVAATCYTIYSLRLLVKNDYIYR